MRIDIDRFSGMRPIMEPELLQPIEAQLALDATIETGALEGKPIPTAIKALTKPAPKTIWRYPTPSELEHWFEFSGRASVIRSPIVDDVWDRVYWTEDAGARYAPMSVALAGASYPAASFPLGLPAPNSRPSTAQAPSGRSEYLATIFRSDSVVPAFPSGGTFNFTSNTLTPPAGWSVTQPALTTGNRVYVVEYRFVTDTPGATVTAGTWTNYSTAGYSGPWPIGYTPPTPGVGLAAYSLPGPAAVPGSFVVTLYRQVPRADGAASVAPSAPGTTFYNAATRTIDTPPGWTDTLPLFSYQNAGLNTEGYGGFTWYRVTATVAVPTASSSVAVTGWSSPIPVMGTADPSWAPITPPRVKVKVYKQSPTAPSAPSGGYYTFPIGNGGETTFVPPSGWSIARPTSGSDPVYSCEYTFDYPNTYPNTTAIGGSWSAPALEDVQPIAAGPTRYVQGVYVYRQLASRPGAPGGGSIRVDTNVATPPSDWVLDQPAPSTTPTYRTAAYIETSSPGEAKTITAWQEPVLASFLPATGTTEGRAYMETFVTAYDEEGPRSDISSVVNVDPTKPVEVTGLAEAPSGYSHINRRRLYRTSYTGGSASQFQLVAELPVGVTSFTDSVRQVDLGKTWETELYLPPPDGCYGMTVTDAGVVVVLKGREVHMSEPGLPHAFNPDYTQTLQHETVAAAAFGQSLVVLTKGGLYVGNGFEPAALRLTRLEDSHPALNASGVVVTRGGCYYPSPEGLVSITTDFVPTVATKELLTQRQWLAYNPASFVAALQNGRYHAFFAREDGTLGEFIFDPTGKGAPFVEASQVAAQPVTAAYRDPSNDTLYIATNGQIKRVNKTGAPQPYTWRSKAFDIGSPRMLSAFLVDGTGSVTFRAFADGQLVHTKTLPHGRVGRLPTGIRASKWSFEVTSSDKTTRIRVAPSVQELYTS